MVHSLVQTQLVIHAGTLIQSMDAWTGTYSWNDAAYRALALLCGLWTPPAQPTEVGVLSWSPLKAEESAELGGHGQGTLLNRARDWIRDRFAAALAQFEDNGMKSMKAKHPRRCQRFSIAGEWT